MVRYAYKDEFHKIKMLFNECFPEDISFNEHFFENEYSDKNTLVYVENGNILSMLQNIPYEINGIGRVSYIYGACTEKSSRGKGLMAKLIYAAFNEDKKNGVAASILIPANVPLFNFYGKFGYREAFYLENYEFKGYVSNCQYFIREASVKDIDLLNEIYEKYLDGICFVKRNRDYWQKQINLFNSLGGNVFVMENKDNNADGYAFCWNTDVPTIQEVFCSDIKTASETIAKYYGKERIKAFSLGKGTAFGCIKEYNHSIKHNDNMYMNLMFN